MSEVSDVKKAFEDSLRRIDELIEVMRVERDRAMFLFRLVYLKLVLLKLFFVFSNYFESKM